MILIVAGVSGSGKSTVGAMLADRLHWPFADGDDFHPAANVAKMRVGIPLTDSDRWPWLRAIAAWMDERIARGESAVIACSALKRSYRDVLLDARHGHFFPAVLLATQFDALEPPQSDEHAITVVEGADDRPGDIVTKIIGLVWPGDGAVSGSPGGDHEAET